MGRDGDRRGYRFWAPAGRREALHLPCLAVDELAYALRSSRRSP